ncbi:MAG: hypothetical protein P8J32_08725 [bacterium]|jgi:hypothetical protein|nr:hypothetical protein [bacterium]
MWRQDIPYTLPETEFFDRLIARIESNEHLRAHADASIDAAVAQEPLFSDALTTPQDIRYHAEGPMLRDHVRLILTGLFAIMEGEFRLLDVEEFRRLKGYETEFEDLELVIKENIGFLQVFAMCHDVAKYLTVTFSAPEGSLGAKEGFATQWSDHFDEAALQRAQAREDYWRLYHTFAASHPHLPERDIQAQFYSVYQIQVHYHRHGRAIYVPVYEALVDRFCQAYQLPGRDHDMMLDLISHHMEVITDFEAGVNPTKIQRYVTLARKRGYDPDDYIDLMQACLFIDAVVGSKRLGARGCKNEPAALIHCLQSEHNLAPWRREERLRVRKDRKFRERNQVFKEVGLDGLALMDLLKMDPGPEFGIQLRRIHAAIQGAGELPIFGKEMDAVLSDRIGQYYQSIFSGAHDV